MNGSPITALVAMQVLILPVTYFVWVLGLAAVRAFEPNTLEWRH